MRSCKHGFNPATGPGLWCPMCDVEEKRGPLWRRLWKLLLGTAP